MLPAPRFRVPCLPRSCCLNRGICFQACGSVLTLCFLFWIQIKVKIVPRTSDGQLRYTPCWWSLWGLKWVPQRSQFSGAWTLIQIETTAYRKKEFLPSSHFPDPTWPQDDISPVGGLMWAPSWDPMHLHNHHRTFIRYLLQTLNSLNPLHLRSEFYCEFIWLQVPVPDTC